MYEWFPRPAFNGRNYRLHNEETGDELYCTYDEEDGFTTYLSPSESAAAIEVEDEVIAEILDGEI